MKYFIYQLLFLFFLSQAIAQPKSSLPSSSATPETKKTIQLSFSLISLMNRHFRGALLWDNAALSPGISVTIKEKWAINGPSLSYVHQFNEQHHLKGSVQFFSDSSPSFPWISFGKNKISSKRKATLFLAATYEFILKKLITFQLSMTQDMALFHGRFIFVGFSFKKIPLVSLDVGIGFGDQASNRYTYGEGAREGLSHFEFGGGLFLPFLPLKGILIAKIQYQTILTESNKQASFVKNQPYYPSAFLMASWKL